MHARKPPWPLGLEKDSSAWPRPRKQPSRPQRWILGTRTRVIAVLEGFGWERARLTHWRQQEHGWICGNPPRISGVKALTA